MGLRVLRLRPRRRPRPRDRQRPHLPAGRPEPPSCTSRTASGRSCSGTTRAGSTDVSRRAGPGMQLAGLGPRASRSATTTTTATSTCSSRRWTRRRCCSATTRPAGPLAEAPPAQPPRQPRGRCAGRSDRRRPVADPRAPQRLDLPVAERPGSALRTRRRANG